MSAGALDQMMVAALTDAMHSVGSHAKWTKNLLQTYEKSPKAFMLSLLPQLYKTLVIFKRDPLVERLIWFVCRLAVEPTVNPALTGRMAMVIIQSLLRFQNSKKKSCRFRVCQIVGSILTRMDDDCELSDALFTNIQETMLERIKDKIPAVRAMACSCLSRLQDPTGTEDVVLVALLSRLNHDPSHVVRKAALLSLGISKLTLSHILLRVKDINPDMRIAAFNICADKVGIRALSILERKTVLYSGIMDRDDNVRRVCRESLLPVWMKQCNGSILKLLSSLDVQEYQEECEAITLFLIGPEMKPPVDIEDMRFQGEHLVAEEAFFWRIFCERMRKTKNADAIETVFPDPVEFIDALSEHQDNSFITAQLVRIGSMLEMDEVGRTTMTNLFLDWLRSENLEIGLITVVMTALQRIMVPKQNSAQGESEFITNSLLVLADLRDPLEESSPGDGDNIGVRDQLSQLEAHYSDLQIRLDEAEALISKHKGRKKSKKPDEVTTLIAQLHEQLAEVDEEMLAKEELLLQKSLRLITFTSAMLEWVERTPFSSLVDLGESTIFPALTHEAVAVREEAIRCLCLLSLRDCDTAKRNSMMFIQAIRNDEPPIQLMAVKMCFDLILAHRLHEDPSMKEVLDLLIECLDSDQSDIRTVACIGFSKMFTLTNWFNNDVLASLALSLFDPKTEDDLELRQTLSVFFPIYSESSSEHRKALGQIWSSVIRSITESSKSSTLRKLSSAQVTPFFLFLLKSDGVDFGSFSLSICGLWLGNPRHTFADKFYAHLILSLPIPSKQAKELDYLLKRIRVDVADKQSLRYIDKVIATLKSNGVENIVDLTDEQVGALERRIELSFSLEKEPDQSVDCNADDAIEGPTIHGPHQELDRSDLGDDPIEVDKPDPISPTDDSGVHESALRTLAVGSRPRSRSILQTDQSTPSSATRSKRRERSVSTESLRQSSLSIEPVQSPSLHDSIESALCPVLISPDDSQSPPIQTLIKSKRRKETASKKQPTRRSLRSSVAK